jgi:hypothetical protein
MSQTFLAYFPKMKVDLSNHQPVCPQLIAFKPLGNFHEISYGGNAIQGDLNANNF